MNKNNDTFFVANVTMHKEYRHDLGWSVFRKSEDQEPRDPSRVWVRLIPQQGMGILGERISIPKGTIRIRTKTLANAARAAAIFNTADRLEADCVAAAKAQRAFTFAEVKDRYDTP